MFLFLTYHWKEKKHKNFFFKSITTIQGKFNADRKKKKKLSSKTTKYINYLFLKRKKAEQKIHLNNIKRKLLKNTSSSLSSPFEPFHVICNFKNDKLKALQKYNIEEKKNNAHNLLKNISQQNGSNVEYLKCIASTGVEEKNHLIETNSPKEENGTFFQMGDMNFVNYDKNYMNGQDYPTNSQTNYMNGQDYPTNSQTNHMNRQDYPTNSQINHMNGQDNLTNNQTNYMNGQDYPTNSQINHMNRQDNLTNSQTNHMNIQDYPTNSQTNHMNRQDYPTNSRILVSDYPSGIPSYNKSGSDRYLEENKFLPTVCIKKDKELKDMKSWNNINNILDLRKNKELCNIYLITSMINIYHENNYNYIILKILKEMKYIHCMSMKHISLIIYNIYKYYYIQYIKNIFYRSDEINRSNFFNSYYILPEDGILYNNEFKIKDVLLDIEIIKRFLLSISCVIKTYIYNESDMNVLSKILFVYCFFEINNKKMNEMLIDKILKSIHIKTNKRIEYFSLITLSFEKLKIYYSKIHLLHSNLLIKKMNKLIKEYNKLIISNNGKNKKKKKKKKNKQTKLERLNLFPIHKKHKTFSLINMKDIITYLYIIKMNNIKNNEFIKTLLKYCNIFLYKINWEDKNNSYIYSYYNKVNKKSYRTLDLFCNEENIIPLCYQHDMLRNIKLYKSFENEIEKKKRKKNLLNSYKDIIILKRRTKKKNISHNDVNKYLALHSLYNINKTTHNDTIRENDYRNNVLIQVQNIRRETTFREKLLYIGSRAKEMIGKHNYVEGENNIKEIEKINDGVMKYEIEDNRINREVISCKDEKININKKGVYSSYEDKNIHLNNKNKLYYIENNDMINKYETNLICISIFLKYLISYDYVVLKNRPEFNKLIEMYMNLIRGTNMKNIHFLYMYNIIEINRHIELYNNFLTKLIYSSIFYNCKNGLLSFLGMLKRVENMNTVEIKNKKLKDTLIKMDDSIEATDCCSDHNYDKPYEVRHVSDDDTLFKLISSRYMWLYSLINLYIQLLKSKTHDCILNDMLLNNLIVLINYDFNHLSFASIYGCLKLLYMIENGMKENGKKENKDPYVINFRIEEEEEYYNSLHNKCNKILFMVLKKLEFIEFVNIKKNILLLLLLKIYKYINKIKIYRHRFENGSYGMLLKIDDMLKKKIIIETKKNIYNLDIKDFIKIFIYSDNKLRNELFHMSNLDGHFLLLTNIVNKMNNNMYIYFFDLYKCIYIYLYNYIINKEIKKLNDKNFFINKHHIINSIKLLQFLRNYITENMSKIQKRYIYKIIMYNFFYINECIKLTNMLYSSKDNKTDFIYNNNNNKIITNESNNYYDNYVNIKKLKKKKKKGFIIYMLVKHVDIMFDIINMLLKKEKNLFLKILNEKNVLIYIFSLYMENISRVKKKIIGYLFFSSNKNRTHGKEFLYILLKNKLEFYNNKMNTCDDIRHITYMNVLILFLLFKYEIFLRNYNIYKRCHRKQITYDLNKDVPYFEGVHNTFKYYKDNKNISYNMLLNTHNNDVIFLQVLFYAITKNYFILNNMYPKNFENIYINKIKRKQYNNKQRNDTDVLLQNSRDEGNKNKSIHYENDLFELIITNFNILSEHHNDNKYFKSIIYNFMVHKNDISQVINKILNKNKSEKYVIEKIK
ncbi:conserved Plasmodium protein, unknown function [Plasmodium reichenowi]|uniref:Uncharacterized protein n=1 Tax=Plasmodium reichenowi TaxID=5854 RepID=A0A060RP93_PLARE|nr:conserved Plasmodium protein, unknown function [Plasmodium reichenowi]